MVKDGRGGPAHGKGRIFGYECDPSGHFQMPGKEDVHKDGHERGNESCVEIHSQKRMPVRKSCQEMTDRIGQIR